jgi:hypothetical protein
VEKVDDFSVMSADNSVKLAEIQDSRIRLFLHHLHYVSADFFQILLIFSEFFINRWDVQISLSAGLSNTASLLILQSVDGYCWYEQGLLFARQICGKRMERAMKSTVAHTQLFLVGDIVTPSLAVSSSVSSNITPPPEDIRRKKKLKRGTLILHN